MSCSVRTRLDLPDKLMRELKARAAFGGVKLKDHFANIAHAALQRPIFRGAQPNRSPVPVFKRLEAKARPAISNTELYAILDSKEGGWPAAW